ncbi:MAG: hypothetical protein DRG82_03315 [Deltaproteobacteria bacterium]|nr:MAG: hypothetical protein DRG82_03315 [Deltaproteobacteria bacterium]
MEEPLRFKSRRDYEELQLFLNAWNGENGTIKCIFLQFQSILAELPGVVFDFVSRPGVSISLRAERVFQGNTALFALVDVVDDDPESRWLSVCFPSVVVSDPQGLGNLISEGISGRDGYCFDVFEEDASFFKYLEERIREAFERSKGLSLR